MTKFLLLFVIVGTSCAYAQEGESVFGPQEEPQHSPVTVERRPLLIPASKIQGLGFTPLEVQNDRIPIPTMLRPIPIVDSEQLIGDESGRVLHNNIKLNLQQGMENIYEFGQGADTAVMNEFMQSLAVGVPGAAYAGIEPGNNRIPCCGNSDSIVCQTSNNVCNEFAQSFAPELSTDGEGATEVTDIASLLMYGDSNFTIEARGTNGFDQRTPEFCTRCYATSFLSTDPSLKPEDFDRVRNNQQRYFFDELVNQKVEKSMKSFHHYNEMLYRFYGIYGMKLDEQIASSRDQKSDFLCMNSGEMLNKLQNPGENSKCSRLKSRLGEEEYNIQMNQKFSLGLTSVGIVPQANLADSLNNYINNFDVAHLPEDRQCITRARHAQVMAAQFHDTSSAKKANLLYELMDSAFPNESPSERRSLRSGPINDYCTNFEVDQGVIPLEILKHRLWGEDSQIVAGSLNSPQSSDLKTLLSENNVNTKNFRTVINNLLGIAKEIEPTFGLIMTNKDVFCEHYINPRKRNRNIGTKDIITHKRNQNSASSYAAFQKTAANACEKLEQNLIDSMCAGPADFATATDAEISKALEKTAESFATESDSIGINEQQIISNSIACQIPRPSNQDLVLSNFEDSNLNAEELVSHWGEDGMHVLKHNEDDHHEEAGDLAYLDFDFVNMGLHCKNKGSEVASCRGRNLAGGIESLYRNLGHSGVGLANLITYGSQGGGIRVRGPVDSLSPDQDGIRGLEKCARVNGSAHIAELDNAQENLAGTNPPRIGGSATGSLGGIGGPGGGSPLISAADLGLNPDEIVETAVGGGSLESNAGDLLPATNTELAEEPAYSGVLDRLREQQQLSDQMYNQTQNRYNDALNNMVNDREINPADVAEAVSSDQDMRNRFDNIRDQIERETGSSTNEANNKLINAITDSDNGELASQLGPHNSELLSQIQALRGQIESLKREDDAKEVASSSDEYVNQLEERIRQLEGNSSDAGARARSGEFARTTASLRGGNTELPSLPEGFRSIGGVRGGVPAYLAPEDNLRGGKVNLGNAMGNIAVVRNIIENPDQHIQNDDFNLDYRDNQLYLRVEKKDINEPVDIEDVVLNSSGQVDAVVFSNNKTLSISALNQASQQAINQYVSANISQINQVQTEEIQELRQEVERVREVQRKAAAVEQESDSESAYKELVCSFNSSDPLCQ